MVSVHFLSATTLFLACMTVTVSTDANTTGTPSKSGIARIIRAAKYTTSRSSPKPKARYRSRDKFQVRSQADQENDQAICNSKSNANVTRKGQTYVGSKGLSYSEDARDGKSLICKSKSYKITNRGNSIKRTAAGGSAVISDSANVDKLLSAQQTNTHDLEVGSSGKSAIGTNAVKPEVAAVIDSQGGGAGSSSMSKSRLAPHSLETMSNVDGGTEMKGRKGLGMRGISREATQIFKSPKGRGRGSRFGDTLLEMSHRRRSNFEIEI